MWTIFKVFIESVTILILFWFFGHEACGILAPQPGIEPTSPVLEGKALTTGLPGESQVDYFFFFNLFMAVLGLRFCARAFSSCGKRGPLFIAVCGPLTIAASLVTEHRLQTRRLSNCGSRAQLLRGMWDPPRPGLELVSPALAGRFSTTAPPGKPPDRLFFKLIFVKRFLCTWPIICLN